MRPSWRCLPPPRPGQGHAGVALLNHQRPVFFRRLSFGNQGSGDEVHALGIHQARADGIDVDALGRKFLSQRLSEPDQGELGSAVGGVTGDAPLAGPGGDGDNLARPPRPTMWRATERETR